MRVGIDRTGEGGAKTGEVRTTIHSIDVIREGIDLFVIAIVVLNGNLNRQDVAFSFEIDRFVVQRALVLVEVLNKLGYPAAVIELVRLFRFLALVANGDTNAFV